MDKINYHSKLLCIGSDFTMDIASCLRRYGFTYKANPFGTIYNPISVFKLLNIAANSNSIDENLITETNGVWNHYDFHYQLSSTTRNGLMSDLAVAVSQTNSYLKETDFLFVSMGSAFAYRYNNESYVANCHKSNPFLFDKVLLTPEEIVEEYRKVYPAIENIKNVIFVISPILFSGDSIAVNMVSKSVLRLACHMLLDEFPNTRYFPAYEILYHDLRDYRFYHKDLIHPNDIAMEYIFERFVEGYVVKDLHEGIQKANDIIQSLAQLPYNPQSQIFQQHLNEAITQLDQLNLAMDIKHIKEKLSVELLN